MNEYNEGDLVEAVKGERVVRDRVSVHKETGDLFVTGVGFLTNSSGVAETRHGYSITRIEKAAPKIELPDDAQAVVRMVVADGWDHHWLGWRAHRGTWDLLDPMGTSHSDVSDPIDYIRNQGAPVVEATRLEPVPVTAKKVLDAVRAASRSDGGYYEHQLFEREVRQIATDFGVTS